MYRTEIEAIWEDEESIRKDILVMLSHRKIDSVLQAKTVFPALYNMTMEDSIVAPTTINILSSIELNDELGGHYYDSYWVDEIKEK